MKQVLLVTITDINGDEFKEYTYLEDEEYTYCIKTILNKLSLATSIWGYGDYDFLFSNIESSLHTNNSLISYDFSLLYSFNSQMYNVDTVKECKIKKYKDFINSINKFITDGLEDNTYSDRVDIIKEICRLRDKKFRK